MESDWISLFASLTKSESDLVSWGVSFCPDRVETSEVIIKGFFLGKNGVIFDVQVKMRNERDFAKRERKERERAAAQHLHILAAFVPLLL